MTIIEGIGLSPDSPLIEVFERYLKTSIINNSELFAFSKLAVLSDISVLSEVAYYLSQLVPKKSDYICALAPSGIPLGVAVSIYLQKPLIFYNPQGWERYGISQNILPNIPNNQHVTLIDAHLRTGRSSSWCEGYLHSRYDSIVTTLCTPVCFDKLISHGHNFTINTIGVMDSAINAISRIYQLDQGLVASEINNLSGPFWSWPPSLEHGINEYKSRNPTAKWTEYARGLRSFFRQYPEMRIINDESHKLIHDLPNIKLKNYDVGVWDLFSNPLTLKRICEVVGKEIDLENYDYLIGLGHLGMAFATAVALINTDTFKGKITTWLGEYNLLPDTPNFDGLRILPITMRVQFGTYLMDLLREVKRLDGNFSEVLVGVKDLNTSSILERLRQLSLSRLRQLNIELLCLG